MKKEKGANFINKEEFKFIGLSRSGNHAIINWIIEQINGSYCFLNCTEPKYNPFTSARPLNDEGITYTSNIPDFNLEQEQSGNFSKKDYLLYSHEDCFLGSVNHRLFQQNKQEWIGETENSKNILILRDPFNLFASRIKANLLLGHHTHGARPISFKILKKIYKQHAKEFLGKKNNLKNKVPINYNHWVQNEEYRKSIAEELKIPFSDKGFEQVSNVAGGSSFDGVELSGNANRMKLHDRWKNYEHDESYWELFDDELVDLASEIFGDIPPAQHLQKKSENHLISS